MMKKKLTQADLIETAKDFCKLDHVYKELFGVTDGKAVGTFIEHGFQDKLTAFYDVEIGNSASGLDLPVLNTDIKVTSIKQPQSSSPFRSARQKVYGLGYNLMLFVYDKQDDHRKKTAKLDFVSCAFIESNRTADYTVTQNLLKILASNGNREDIFAFLYDRQLPGNEITLTALADEILQTPPTQGYLGTYIKPEWQAWFGQAMWGDETMAGAVKVA
jgi:hypothetical protein